MKVKPATDCPQHTVEMQGASRCSVRWLVGDAEHAPNFAMREFEVAPGGHTPRHYHAYEHEVYVLAGQGAVIEGTTEHPLRAGDVVYVPPDEVHQFRNTGEGPFRFICLVPNSATGQDVTVVPECGVEPSSS